MPSAIGEAYAEAVGAALLAVASDGRILFFNQKLVESWELPATVLEAKTLEKIVDLLQSRGDEASLALAELLSSSWGSPSGDLALADGRTVAWRKVELPQQRGYLWTFQDVSETRQMAAAMVNAVNWLQMLEVHTNGVLLELDENASIVGIWGFSEAFFEQPDGAIQGKSLAEAIGAPEGAVLDACIRRVLATGAPEEHEYALEVHGTRRVFNSNAVLMPAGEKGIKRATLMIRDVTERARMQAQLVQSERLASVGLLAAGVAHEVNNPLAYVLLNLERVKRGLSALRSGAAVEIAELESGVEISLEGARRVRSIVRDLTHFSRSDDATQMPIDLHRPLDFAITMAEPEIRRRANVARDFGATPPIRASESRLSQLFLNLIVNAAHAIPEGRPEDNEIRVVTRTDGSGRAVVEVHDTGKGIPPVAMPHIFEPFYTTKPAGLGTGLGLTICHTIATALKGSIHVESTEHGGSVFRVLLPPRGEQTGDAQPRRHTFER